MDCSSILEILDCVRPDSGDLDLPEFADARAHLDGCESCQQEFAVRQDFDRAISGVIVDVEVPAGSQESLLAEVAEPVSSNTADSEPAQAESATTKPERRQRKTRTRLSLAALACTAAIALLISYWPSEPERFSVDGLLVKATADPEKVMLLEEFSGEPVPDLPRSFRHRSLGTGSTFYGQDLDGDERHDLAMTIFKFRSRAHGVVTGVVAAIPANRLTALPATKSFSSGSHVYPSPGGFATASVVWVEGDTVYLAFVPHRYAPALEAMQRELRGRAA